MNLIELKTFLAIVETGSLVRASSILNVTQSTVTSRLKSLEDEIGQQLFIRLKSGATLTPAGTRLRRYAETISDLWIQARQETNLPDGLDALCNIACELDLWTGMAEKLFHFLRDSHSELAVSIWQGSQSDVAGWMTQGKSDLAITYSRSSSARELQFELPSDRLVLYSTEENSPIRFDPNYVFIEAGEEFGRDHAAAYADADTARLSFNNAALGLAHLQASGGSAYLPERLAAPLVQQGELFELSGAPVFKRPVFLNVNKSARKAWGWFDDALHTVLRNAA